MYQYRLQLEVKVRGPREGQVSPKGTYRGSATYHNPVHIGELILFIPEEYGTVERIAHSGEASIIVAERVLDIEELADFKDRMKEKYGRSIR